ncbi:MAG TPA: thermonuclease family protein [Kiritimatiellia bacterium]
MQALCRALTALLLLSFARAEAARWYTKEGCKLIADKSNDGDSFHVSHNGREYIYRLYFVDTPETDDSMAERIVEQGTYFGIADGRSVIKLGKDATDFSEKFLAKGFTVTTKGEDARGRSELDRDYAFISVDKDDLGVELVRAGLARVFGVQESPPTGPSVQLVRMRLKSAEKEAREMKRGAWALSDPKAVGRPLTAAPAVATVGRQELSLPRSLAYYSLLDGRYLGVLQQSTRVLVLRAESANMVRLRFMAKPGTSYEVQCKRSDLPL